MWRYLLTISRDVYHKHPYELTPEQVIYCRDFAALVMMENEEWKEKHPG